MKKIILLIIILMPSLFSGCVVGAGMGDYKIKLSEDYSILRTSSKNIIIGKNQGDGAWSEVIPSKINEANSDDNYIIAKQVTETNESYWVINLKNDEIYRKLSYDEFIQKSQELNIDLELKSLTNLKKEYGVK